MRVLLINSPSLGIIEPWQDTPDFGRSALAYLAGYLRNSGYPEIKIIDAKLERLGFEEVIKQTIDYKPTIIGFTAFTNEIKPCAYLAHKIKQIIPETKTIIGGAHVTALPLQTLGEFPGFDFAVFGEGEITLLELCQAIENGSNQFTQIKGLVFRQNGQIRMNETRDRILNQNEIPIPAWDLMPPAKTYWIQSQRGCPMNCVFCMNHNGKVVRKSEIETVIEEIEYVIEKFKPEWIRFGDELFSADMNRTEALLDAMIERKIGNRVKWDIQTHVNFVDERLFKKLKLANCQQVDLGVETGDQELLKKMGKGTNHEKIANAFHLGKKNNLTLGSFFLFGQPFETPETIRKTIVFATKLNPDIPMFGLMVPYPGTRVAKLAANNEAGYLNLSYDWDQYRKQIGGAVTFANLTRNQLEFYQLLAYVSIFIRNLRLIDFLAFLFKYKNEAKNLLLKILSGKETINHKLVKPNDYELVLESTKITAEEMVNSYEDFDQYQRKELQRTKRIKANLIEEQIPRK